MSLLRTLVAIANKADLYYQFEVADLLTDFIRIASDISPPFSKEEATIIADAIGIDFESSLFSINDFMAGLSVELEHGTVDPETDVIHKNYLNLGKIAWAHLKEDPQYYAKLKLIEAK